MDYRMYSEGAPAGADVVTLIKESLKSKGVKLTSAPLKMIAFEGSAGTRFFLNGHVEPTEIPSTGQFITPYSGAYYMSIYKLVFEQAFFGNIYYIL